MVAVQSKKKYYYNAGESALTQNERFTIAIYENLHANGERRVVKNWSWKACGSGVTSSERNGYLRNTLEIAWHRSVT